MQHVQQTGTTQATTKVSTVDLLQAIKDLNERPDYGSKNGATINPIKELLSFRHQSGNVEYTCFMHARDKAMTAGLVSKTGYRYFLTEAGESHLKEETSDMRAKLSQSTDENLTATV
jgi:hypothetical protein